MYVWIYENCPKELKSCPKQAFLPHQKLSLKVMIQKLKGRSVLFFLPLPVYLPFIAVLSLFLFVYVAWKWPKSLVKSR